MSKEPLEELENEFGALIKEAKRKAEETGRPYFIRVGMLLLEAKPQIPDGEWAGWLKRNFKLNTKTANRWMLEAAGETLFKRGGAQ